MCLALSFSLGVQAQTPATTTGTSTSSRTTAQPATSTAATTAPASQASVPRLIKFNGTLKDLAGKPLTGPVDVSFALYKDQTGGTPLWFETQTVEADRLGHYTVLLGAMTPQGVPLELFTSGEAHWLGVQAGNLPESAQGGRVLLLSVPYALKAGDAETLGGKPASAFMLAPQDNAQSSSSTSTSGSTTGSATDSTGGSSTTSSTFTTLTTGTAPLAATITGTQNYIPVFTANDGSLGNSLLYQSGNYIGLGTTLPGHRFTISDSDSDTGATAALGEIRSATANHAALRFLQNSRVEYTLGIDANSSSGKLRLVNTNGAVNVSASTRGIVLDHFGRVGVGTALLGHKFTVSDSDTDPSATAALGEIRSATANHAALRFLQNNEVEYTLGIDANSTSGNLRIVNTNGAVNLALSTRGIILDRFGHVGLGTTTPTEALDVAGNINASGSVTASTFSGTATNSLALGGVAPSGYAPAVGSPSYVAKSGDIMTGPLLLPANGLVVGTSQLALASGYVGIGTSVPNALLDVSTGSTHVLVGDAGCGASYAGVGFGTSLSSCHDYSLLGNGTDTILNRPSGGDLLFRENNTTEMTIASHGNVGIGTTAPAATLEVHGPPAAPTVTNFNGVNGEPGLQVIAQTGEATQDVSGIGGAGGPITLTAGTGGKNTGGGIGDYGNGGDGGAIILTGGVGGGNSDKSAGATGGRITVQGGGGVEYRSGFGSARGLPGDIHLSPGEGGFLLTQGHVLIDTATYPGVPTNLLSVWGDITVGQGTTSADPGCVEQYGGSAIAGTCSSDERLKKNIQPFDPALEKLVRLQPVHFHWRVKEFPEYHFGPQRNSGLIAQQVEKVFPEMVATDAHGYKMVNYSELPYLILEGVRELKARNDLLRAEVQVSHSEIAKLEQSAAAKDARIRALSREITQLKAQASELAALETRLARDEAQEKVTRARLARVARGKKKQERTEIAHVQF